MSKLRDYRAKREAGATNEPFGDADSIHADGPTLSGAFVVHLHDATRRHYDLRLEIGSVLASFAVPHGPSIDPEAKHLAVRTEDHPLEYVDFEDVIPAGLYGAGSMIVWDRGSAEYLEGPAEEEIANGKLHVFLRGQKLRGAFALVKLAKSAKGNEWLLFKKNDEHARKGAKIIEELPRSVLSGLTVDELANARAVGAARAKGADAAPAIAAAEVAELTSMARSPLHASVSGDAAGDDFVFDPVLDGVRVLAAKLGDSVVLRTFTDAAAQPIEAFYPEILRALRSLPYEQLLLDGELVAFDASGHPSLALLAKRAPRMADDAHRAVWSTPVFLVATDVLVVGERDVRRLPLEARRELLEAILPPLGIVRSAAPLVGPTSTILETCAAHGIEGVIAKRRGSTYGTPSSASVRRTQAADWVRLSTGLAPRSRATVDHTAKATEGALRSVTLTNKDKVFWPERGLTKAALYDYYARLAPWLLPYLEQRPIVVVRYPDGIHGKSFFQWNVPPGMPAWVRTLALPEDESGHARRGFLVDDVSTLLYLANLACIPLHVLASRAPHFDRADFVTIDFDVKQSKLAHAVTLALSLAELLVAIGLEGFPKTSGQSGLHVLVPLGPNQSFETARALAELLGKLLVDRHPDLATTERAIVRRGAKVFVDTGQNGASRAIVAPYSVRATPDATVSTPLTWSEVRADLDPARYTIETVPARVARHGDPMKPMLAARPDVSAAVAKLAARLGGDGTRPP